MCTSSATLDTVHLSVLTNGIPVGWQITVSLRLPGTRAQGCSGVRHLPAATYHTPTHKSPSQENNSSPAPGDHHGLTQLNPKQMENDDPPHHRAHIKERRLRDLIKVDCRSDGRKTCHTVTAAADCHLLGFDIFLGTCSRGPDSC